MAEAEDRRSTSATAAPTSPARSTSTRSRKWAATQPDVAVARDYKYMCSDPGQELIQNDIKEHGVDRVVVAACSPTMHEPTFRKALRRRRPQPVPLPDGQHPRALLVGAPKTRRRPPRRPSASSARRSTGCRCNEPLEPIEVPVNPRRHGGRRRHRRHPGGPRARRRPARRSISSRRTRRSAATWRMFDKTFPTLDCAACILTPKMSAAGKDPNIEMLTYSEVTRGRRLRRQLQGQGQEEGALRRHRQVHRLRRLPGGLRRAQGHERVRRWGWAIAAPSTSPSRRPCRCAPRSTREAASRSRRGKCAKQPCVRACGPEAIDFDAAGRVRSTSRSAPSSWRPASSSGTRPKSSATATAGSRTSSRASSSSASPTPRARPAATSRCKNGEAPEVGRHPALRRQPRRELPASTARASAACTRSSSPTSSRSNCPRPRSTSFYIDMRCLRQGLRGVLQAPHGRGRALHPRPRRRGHRRRRCRPTKEGRLVVTGRGHAARHHAAPARSTWSILSAGLGAAQSDAKAVRRSSASAAAPTASSSSGIPSWSRSPPSPTASSSPAAARAPRTSPTRSPRRAPPRPGAWRWSTTRRSRSSRPSRTSTPRSAAGCHICIDLCPLRRHPVRTRRRSVAEVIEAACKGCGVCVAACGSNVPPAARLPRQQIFAEIEGAMAV